MKRYAIYARSAPAGTLIEEQVRDCEEYVDGTAARTEEQICACEEYVRNADGQVVDVYQDVSSSSTKKFRRGYQKLLEDIAQHKFDFIVAEDLSRWTRDVGAMGYLYKLCQFHGVQLTTLAEGQVDETHIGPQKPTNTIPVKDSATRGYGKTKEPVCEEQAQG